ncbi:hypothetical protein L3Y34_016944 [Caenorhabditis briggsae]|uniref:FHA domain-containing protein n=1 Tax=Caenorhabditis briggsae TaxID=6238 RepID=A0AAE9DHE0_CAEBR|nr:hypothetical protein L3Y34_016944 [Caenorhabditis briggsae]
MNSQDQLFLRRLARNTGPPRTEPPTDDELLKAIVSLQNKRTNFGRSLSNDVIFFRGESEDEKEDVNISRHHAHIDVTYSNLAKNLIYRIEDHSENGTYINDRRLCKEERHILEIGQVVKFGHRNSLSHPAGAEIAHPEADFAFIVDMADEDTVLGRKVLNIKDRKVKVLSKESIVRDLGVRDHSEPLPAATQVMEADSTNNGLPEPSESNNTAPSTSTAGPSTSGDTATSSTSVATSSSAPPTSSPVNGSTSNGSLTDSEQMPCTSSSSSSSIILLNAPAKAPHESRFDDPKNLSRHRLTRVSKQFADKLMEQYARLLVQIPALEAHKDAVTELLSVHCCVYTQFLTRDQKLELLRKQCADDAETKELAEFCEPMAEFLAAEDEQEKTVELNDLVEQLAADGSPKKDTMPWVHSETSAFRSTATPPTSGIWKPRARNPLNSEQHYINHLRSLNVAHEKVEPLADAAARNGQLQAFSPTSFSFYHAVQLATFSNYAYGKCHYQHYLTPVRRAVDVVPIAGAGGGHGHIGVIAHAPGRERIDIDEERHSASSGSTTDNNFSRRRTDSEESEIDVVGTEDDDAPQVPQIAAESPEDVVAPAAPENAPESPDAEDAEEEEMEEMEGEETESTPTPSPDDVVKEPEIDLRQSTTPRMEAQSTPSAVVSTGPTPLSSPIPKKTSEDVTPPSESTLKENAEKAADTVEEVVKENVKKIKAIAATMTPSSGAPTSSGATPSTSDASASKKKKTSTSSPKERRMKQLDDASSAESDSEDDGGKKKAKTSRRSTRKATSPRKPRKDDEDVANDETSKKETPKTRRKPAARRTDGEGTTSSRRKRAVDDDGSEQEPQPRKQQRRGRKKNGDDSDDADKEKCGVAKLSHCLCVKLERRKDLQWVSCSDCSQWFHVYCVRLNNQSYAEEDVFSCCGPNASPEAVASLAGEVAAQYRDLRHQEKIESLERI